MVALGNLQMRSSVWTEKRVTYLLTTWSVSRFFVISQLPFEINIIIPVSLMKKLTFRKCLIPQGCDVEDLSLRASSVFLYILFHIITLTFGK